MPTMPQVDISTGIVTPGPNGGVTVDQQFQWVNNSSSTCTITAPAGSAWFSPSPCTVNPYNSAPNTGVVTALLENETPGWTYLDSCPQTVTNPHIPVGGA